MESPAEAESVSPVAVNMQMRSASSPTPSVATPIASQQQQQQKRSSFSISNLLATEDEKRTSPDGKHQLSASSINSRPAAGEQQQQQVEELAALNKALGSSPFLNASALAHLAHLHGAGTAPSSTAGPAPPATWDWLGTAAIGPESHQSLWSR